MKKVILDTNVGLVAAGAFEVDGGKPTMALKTWCTDLLCKIMQNEVGLVIDEDREIVSEYLHKMPGYALGGEFIKWLSCNIWSGGTVSRVGIHKTKGGYVEFPADKELSEFDLSDRKFIAVAVANKGAAPIQEATDG